MSTKSVDFNATPYELNFTRDAGALLYQPITLTVNGAQQSLSGFTLALTVTASDGTVVIDSQAITPDNVTLGTFTLLVTATQSADLKGPYSYEVVCTWPAGDATIVDGGPTPILAGTITYR